MIALYKDPEGETILKSSATGTTGSSAAATNEGEQNLYKLLGTGRNTCRNDECHANDEDLVLNLKKKIEQLEQQLTSYQQCMS